MSNSAKKVVLVIMDGWGLAPADKFNAIANANTPNIDKLIRDYPNTSLKSDGEAVGLEEGQFGTSEINHLTIGSGRIVMQDLPKINHHIKQGSFYSNPALHNVVEHVQTNNSRLHILGILSDGGVHSRIDHLFAIFEMLNRAELWQPVYLHLFSDGRDVAPRSVEKYLAQLEEKIAEYPKLNIQIATLQGRYFLDRDRDWNITEKAYQLMASAQGNSVSDPQAAINLEYNQSNQDEYFGQYVFQPGGVFKPNDGIIMFHYRTDRQYQIVKRILDADITNLKVASFVKASEEFTNLEVAFPREKIDNTLAEVLSQHQKTQLHITETEKYPHLTYFLNGEREVEFAGEEWQMFESNRLIKPRYSFEPSMRNFDIARRLIQAIEEERHDFIIVNFSSPDMVGHTGNYNAAVVSAESVDFCMGLVYEAIKDKLDRYALIITADHGNSEIMWDYENNQPHTQHTLSKVPFILVSDQDIKLARREGLENVAPTVLDLMDLPKPSVMTGESLLRE
jgi:2,3-bisphosphoglycerate-independent phosphoglycerate mutase